MFYFMVTLLGLVLIADVLLGLLVLLQGRHKVVNRVFAALTLSFVIWSGSGFYIQGARHSDFLFDFMVVAPFIAATFIAYCLVLFSLYFPETRPNSRQTRRIVIGLLSAVAVTIAGLFAVFPHLMIADVTTSATKGNGLVYGPLYRIFPLYVLGSLVFTFANLIIKSRRTRDRREKVQLNYVFIGFLLFSTVAVANNIVVPALTHNHSLARFGFLSTLFVIGFIGYAIAAHRLFNIRPLVARSIAYLLLLATATGLYSAAIIIISGNVLHFNLRSGEAVVYIVLAILLAATFHPLRRFFEKITDRFFYRDRYDSQVVLDNVGTILAAELLLDNLLAKSLREICRGLRLDGGQFVVFDHDKIHKEVHTPGFPRQPLTLAGSRQLHTGILVADELEAGPRKELLDTHGIRVSLLLQTKGQTVGYLFLGNRLSGDMYSQQDLTVLEILRKELAVAITNAKAYEEISEFNATLQERIRQATQRLRDANANLRVLDKAKDDFISMASHQLGTPLTAIMGYLSMAIDDDKGNMTIQQREFVNFALEAAERMNAMSLDLLNVSRLNSGRFIIQREPVDLDAMVQQEVQQLRPAAERKGLKLIYQSPGTALPRALIDLSKTRQVIMNFIDNAIYYTPKGSVTVNLAVADKTITFTVTDTGIGVPESERGHLFAKFYRAENARATRPDGTGLGLYLAKQVVEDQGGQIIFDTHIGTGSTFGFHLPLVIKD